MALKPRHHRIVGLLLLVAGIAAYMKVAGDPTSSNAGSIISMMLGVSLAIIQLHTGFAPHYGRGFVSRAKDPFSYWLGFVGSTVPFIAGGIYSLWAD